MKSGYYNPVIKLHTITKLLKCFYISIYVSVLIPLISHSMAIDAKPESTAKTNLQKKHYQQALYYYFQGNYSAALNIISVSKSRLNVLDQTSQLFEAGLQVNMGLQEQAKQTLLSLGSMNGESKTESNELLVVTLLSLTEQFIAQGNMIQAKQALAKVSHITQGYYQQYHVLSQLAYWPEQPELLPVFLPKNEEGFKKADLSLNEVVYQSPYIQLNEALRLIDKGEFTSAIKLLTLIKSRQWQAPKQTFWQLLFTTEKELSIEKETEAQLQNQAVNDYARLLLAQLYAKQERYEKSFFELKSFPQHSPYTEPALFLFAFSAQQIKHHTTALSILTLLHKQYPYSPLGWQASLLMGKQVTEQAGSAQGWKVYKDVEKFFLKHIEKLNDFENNFSESTDLLDFSSTITTSDTTSINTVTTSFIDSLKLETTYYTPKSVWLQQALYDASLNSLYQQLSQLTVLEKHSYTLQRKSDWIAEIIKLNTQRKARIAASQSAILQQGVYEKLIDKRERLSAVLTSALSEPQQRGFTFANKEEQAMIDRLNRSKENLKYIVEHNDKSEQGNIDDYQQRLTRLSAVLTWKLQQQYPQRAWQHKQKLIDLDKHLQSVNALQKKISLILKGESKEQNNHSLSQFTHRQIMENKRSIQLTNHLQQLKSKVSLAIRVKVSHYIDEQRLLLTQHLLTTRRAMAGVLEQMSHIDKKMESQLNIDAQTRKEKAL